MRPSVLELRRRSRFCCSRSGSRHAPPRREARQTPAPWRNPTASNVASMRGGQDRREAACMFPDIGCRRLRAAPSVTAQSRRACRSRHRRVPATSAVRALRHRQRCGPTGRSPARRSRGRARRDLRKFRRRTRAGSVRDPDPRSSAGSSRRCFERRHGPAPPNRRDPGGGAQTAMGRNV